MMLRPFVVVEAQARGRRQLLSGKALALVGLALQQEGVALLLWAAAVVGETSQLGLALVGFLLGV